MHDKSINQQNAFSTNANGESVVDREKKLVIRVKEWSNGIEKVCKGKTETRERGKRNESYDLALDSSFCL